MARDKHSPSEDVRFCGSNDKKLHFPYETIECPPPHPRAAEIPFREKFLNLKLRKLIHQMKKKRNTCPLYVSHTFSG